MERNSNILQELPDWLLRYLLGQVDSEEEKKLRAVERLSLIHIYASSRRAAFIPSTGLMKLYVENDQRKASKLFFATEGKKPMKYYGSTSDNMYPHAFRLAEVYLNRAEAYAAKGMTAEALREVNALREKRIPENYEVTAATAADARCV